MLRGRSIACITSRPFPHGRPGRHYGRDPAVGPAAGDVTASAALLAPVAVVMAGCAVVFLAAGRIADLMGTTGNIVLSRLLGVILAALAVQFVIDGIMALNAR